MRICILSAEHNLDFMHFRYRGSFILAFMSCFLVIFIAFLAWAAISDNCNNYPLNPNNPQIRDIVSIPPVLPPWDPPRTWSCRVRSWRWTWWAPCRLCWSSDGCRTCNLKHKDYTMHCLLGLFLLFQQFIPVRIIEGLTFLGMISQKFTILSLKVPLREVPIFDS